MYSICCVNLLGNKVAKVGKGLLNLYRIKGT